MIVLGVIILTDGIFPRLLGGSIALAGLVRVLDSGLYFLGMGYNGEATVLTMLPALISQFGLTGWLLFCSPSLADNAFCKKEK
jgi:hypothetical protein